MLFLRPITTKLQTFVLQMSTAAPNPINATFLRGGTSKGIFLHRSSLPTHQSSWAPIFLGIMGSPDPEHGRQLNGMGGGVSSLSKICVVGPAGPQQAAQGIQVEYTFVQVGIRDSTIDYSGNCGNLSGMIGVFAVDEGICQPVVSKEGIGSVRSFNTNTSKVIDTTFPIDEAGVPVLDRPEVEIAGVPGKASTIVLDFVEPGGARTGKLLPTGSPVDVLEIDVGGERKRFRASLVDATNPTVFVSSEDLSQLGCFAGTFNKAPIENISEDGYVILERLRQAASKKMGLVPVAQAQPKIAILRPPIAGDNVDINVHALSMGVLHKAVPMTIGLCLGVAAKIQGTLAWDIAQRKGDFVRIRHQSGVVDVGAKFSSNGQVESAKVIRTGRRLMKGVVWW